VNLEGQTLTLSGRRDFAKEEKTEEYFWQEREQGRFVRAIQLRDQAIAVLLALPESNLSQRLAQQPGLVFEYRFAWLGQGVNPDPAVQAMGCRHIPDYYGFPLHCSANMLQECAAKTSASALLRLRRSAPRKPVT